MKRLTKILILFLFTAVLFCWVSSGPPPYRVHPVLDCPLTASQSVIYCGSFQLAWNQMTDAYGEPVNVEETELDDQLNAREFTESDVKSDCVSVFGGANTTENCDRYILKTIEPFPNSDSVMPSKIRPTNQADKSGLLAIAYMERSLKFPIAFEPVEKDLVWIGSNGKSNKVKAFGIDDFCPISPEHQRLQQQIEIIDYQNYFDFVVRLKTNSESDELVLAKIPRPRSLKEAFVSVSQRVRNCKKPLAMEMHDELIIPQIYLDVQEDFGKRFRSNQLIGEAIQLIRFSLDEHGAMLQSYSRIELVGIDENMNMHFNGPFLVYLKEKSRDVPYFTIWVDSNEFFKPSDSTANR